jgi:tetratricopeptide (TPR) repeat protein
MRPLVLVGLRGARDRDLVFHPAERAPLVLSSLVPAIDQEQILAFYQEILVAGGRLPRIEVDWVRSLLPTDRRFLRAMRERHGAQRALVVVKVQRPPGDQGMVDLHDVLAQPEVDAFEHVAISAQDPMLNESLVRLAQLAQFVTEIAQERYDEIAEELGLRREAFHSIQHRLMALLNPVDILEGVNALIDVQDEAMALPLAASAEFQSVADGPVRGTLATVEDRVVWRLLSRMFGARPVEEQVLLTAFALNKSEDARTVLKSRHEGAHARLRAAQLIRNEDLAGWATWLREPRQDELLRGAIERNRSRRGEETGWLVSTLKWFPDFRGRERGGDLHRRIFAIFGLINAGKYARADEELRSLELALDETGVSDEVRGDFWDAVGRVRLLTGRSNEGIDALKHAVSLLEKSGAAPTSRGITMNVLAQALRANGRWAEAEPMFREALRLAEEGGDPAKSRGITLHGLARALLDNGRWAEAEPLFREALRLAEVGGDTPTSRGITLDALARGLRDNGRWADAEPMFREALRLKEAGGATPTSRGITLDALARGLRDNGWWAEAEPLFREAMRLKEEGGDTTKSRSSTLRALAQGLRDNGREAEAEPLLREAVRLTTDVGDGSPSSGRGPS